MHTYVRRLASAGPSLLQLPELQSALLQQGQAAQQLLEAEVAAVKQCSDGLVSSSSSGQPAASSATEGSGVVAGGGGAGGVGTGTPPDAAALQRRLLALEGVKVSVGLLQGGLGKAVNGLRKHPCEPVAEAAVQVVGAWRAQVAAKKE